MVRWVWYWGTRVKPRGQTVRLILRDYPFCRYFLTFMKIRVHCDARSRQQPHQTVQHFCTGSLPASIPTMRQGDVSHSDVSGPALAAAGARASSSGNGCVAPVPPAEPGPLLQNHSPSRCLQRRFDLLCFLLGGVCLDLLGKGLHQLLGLWEGQRTRLVKLTNRSKTQDFYWNKSTSC